MTNIMCPFRCINGYLKDKLRVLVTHQSQFLKDVDTIIVLKKVRFTRLQINISMSSNSINTLMEAVETYMYNPESPPPLLFRVK